MDQNMHRTSRMYSFRQIEEEDLKRHYNMIDRMHFSGDQWSGKQMGHSNSWMEDATIACEDPNMPIVFDQE